jgi:hypothetical protein
VSRENVELIERLLNLPDDFAGLVRNEDQWWARVEEFAYMRIAPKRSKLRGWRSSRVCQPDLARSIYTAWERGDYVSDTKPPLHAAAS